MHQLEGTSETVAMVLTQVQKFCGREAAVVIQSTYAWTMPCGIFS